MEVQKILVGTDVSDNAEVAVAEALSVARHTGAHVMLCYATTYRQPPEVDSSSVLGTSATYEDLVRARLDKVRGELERLRTEVRSHGVYACVEIIEGFPDSGLIDTAERIGADLIIVGTHGYGTFKRLLLGSVAERVVRGAHTSVMVVRPRVDTKRAFAKVLVPTDFSVHAERALQMALALSAPGGEIDLLHVWEVPPPAIPYAAPVALGAAYSDLRAELSRAAAAHGRDLISRYANAPMKLQFRQREDTPVHGIQRTIDEGDYDCVVMGSHGRRGLRRWMLGSVAEQTARYAPCSVVVVRGHDN